jgi:hypothetical protein
MYLHKSQKRAWFLCDIVLLEAVRSFVGDLCQLIGLWMSTTQKYVSTNYKLIMDKNVCTVLP